jgi:hypothetical protein
MAKLNLFGIDIRGKVYHCTLDEPPDCRVWVYQGVRAGLGNLPEYPRLNVQRRRWVMPNDPKTGPQLAVRLLFKISVDNWQHLSSPSKKLWRTLGHAKNMSGFNAYMSASLKHQAV